MHARLPSRRPLAAAFTGLVLAAMVAPAHAQSPEPSLSPSTAPAASQLPAASASPGVDASAAPIGDISWSRPRELVRARGGLGANGVFQLPDGRVAVVGMIGGRRSGPGAALWTSSDGRTWAREGLEAEEGSSILGMTALGDTLVATGLAADRTPLVWTGSGGTWSDPQPLDGMIADIAEGDGLLVGAGASMELLQTGVGDAMAFTSSDGVTWTGTALAENGNGAQVVHGPDGGWVVAGVVDNVPTAWTSTDGASWTQVSLADMVGDADGVWYLPAAVAAPWGYVLSFVRSGAQGLSSSVVTSPDGTTWTLAHQDAEDALSGALTSGDEVLLFGYDSIARATDPTTWTRTRNRAFGDWGVVGVGRLPDGRLVVVAAPRSPGQRLQAPVFIGTPEG